LEHLAYDLRALPWHAPRAKPDDLGQVVDGCDLDQLSLHAQRAKDDDATGAAAGYGRNRTSHERVFACIGARVEVQAEPVHPQHPRAFRHPGKRSTKGLLAGDEAAAEHGHEHRERKRDARNDERRPERL